MLGEMSSPWRERAKRAFPGLVQGARLYRLLCNQVRYPVAATVLDLHGTVLAGPFAGLRCPRSGGAGGYWEMLGTYEQCLHPVIEHIIRHPPPAIIVVGAAHGYYVGGLAKRCPDTHVVAYEMDATRVDLMNKYLRINGVMDRVETHATRCEAEDLSAELRREPCALIFMDVEGAEDFLLDPKEVPALYQTEILVELHDVFVPGVTDRIQRRFAGSHRSTIHLEEPPRKPALPATLDRLLRPYWPRMAVPWRVEAGSWLFLEPNSHAAASEPLAS
jgi:hypothetical protein